MKTSTKVLAVSAALLGVATPAFGEGTITSTVSAVYGGFGSRTWVDKNSDSASNYSKITACNRGATLAIHRNRQFPIPDEVVGSERATCNASVYYRAGTAGDIHFVVKSTANDGSLYGNVTIGY